MNQIQNHSMEMFCTALEMKERKKKLYEDAMKACPDQVGIETFRMLKKSISSGFRKSTSRPKKGRSRWMPASSLISKRKTSRPC